MIRSDEELEKMEYDRDIWQEVLDSVQEVLSGGGKRLPKDHRPPPSSSNRRKNIAIARTEEQ
jgi:hypothetical protein